MRLSRGKADFLTRPWTEGRRFALLVFIAVNTAAFVAQCYLDTFQPGFVRDYLAFSGRGVQDAYVWQFVVAPFLHAGPWHFLGNVLFLYFFGRDLESIIGQRHFSYLFLTGAVAGELGHLFLMPVDALLYAASGGVAAIVAAHSTILPELDFVARPFPLTRLRLKARHVVTVIVSAALLLLVLDRSGTMIHSSLLGGCAAGWLYAHLLGFGRPSRIQLTLRRRREAAERRERMSAAEFIEQEIDPLLEKIFRSGLSSLTRGERRLLGQAREKFPQG